MPGLAVRSGRRDTVRSGRWWRFAAQRRSWLILAIALVALVAALDLLQGLAWADSLLHAIVRSGLHPSQPADIAAASPWQRLARDLVPLAIALTGLLWLRPLPMAGLVCALLAMQFGLHLAQPWIRIPFVSASGIVGLLLVHPLWSLMRLNAASRYLRWGTRQLEAALAADLPARRAAPPAGGDFLDRQMAATSAAGRRMRDLHRFVRDGIDHMADATLVLDGDARVFIANQAAVRHWHGAQRELVGCDAHTLLADLRWRIDGEPMVPHGVLRARELAPILGEGQDAAGRILLLRCVPFFDAGNEHAGWTVVLVDITPMRLAQHQRDEALRFISHDLRGPSVSILTAIELARTRPDVPGGEALIERIERHARAGLELADGFVDLARAEAQPFNAVTVDLVALMQQAIDAAWSVARERRVRMRLDCVVEEAPCTADRTLLARALANVLDNALKYSPSGTELVCSVSRRDRCWAISVHDDGPGIAAELQSQLFQPFRRLHRDSHPEVHGIGLGLLLVRTAVQRHGGTIEIDSTAGAGCTVTLVLPAPGHGRSGRTEDRREGTDRWSAR